MKHLPDTVPRARSRWIQRTVRHPSGTLISLTPLPVGRHPTSEPTTSEKPARWTRHQGIGTRPAVPLTWWPHRWALHHPATWTVAEVHEPVSLGRPGDSRGRGPAIATARTRCPGEHRPWSGGSARQRGEVRPGVRAEWCWSA